MAKRELSSTLKNLKFMQRAAPKEEKPKEEEIKLTPDDGFTSLASVSRKCIVITEGNPHPGEPKGRMSFQNFNPAVERMHQVSSASPSQSPLSNATQNGTASERENGDTLPSEETNAERPKSGATRDLKRKQADAGVVDSLGQKARKGQDRDSKVQASLLSSGKTSHMQKREKKLDWNVLRPPKLQARRGGN